MSISCSFTFISFLTKNLLHFLYNLTFTLKTTIVIKLVLLWAQLTKIYPPLLTSVQPISITKTLPIVPTKNERDPPLFTGKLLIKFQNILRNTSQVIVRHRICLQTDGHGETSIPPYNFVAGGITINRTWLTLRGRWYCCID